MGVIYTHNAVYHETVTSSRMRAPYRGFTTFRTAHPPGHRLFIPELEQCARFTALLYIVIYQWQILVSRYSDRKFDIGSDLLCCGPDAI